ncbi:MAG: cysteine desulfurase family protein [Patescibacteria group bacterium]|nr:cysteine desulfurase family protein [Patescibacteria group bacterium]
MIYFDHAATTPVKQEVKKAMDPYFSDKWGNPSSIYGLGREAREAMCEARQTIMGILGAERPSEIIFTSGATESNNLALKGVAEAAAFEIGGPPHIIVSAIEHHCVLDTAKHLESSFGAEVTYLSVNEEGLVNPLDVEKAIKDNTVLVSVMLGNNEMGAIEPVKEISGVIKGEREKREKKGDKTPLYFHTDAVQAFAFMPVKVDELGVDMLSLTAHKFYGPKGVGLLYVRTGTKFAPQQKGGAQEKGRRAGTENVPYIVGMAKAMEMAEKNREAYSKKVGELTDYLVKRVKEIPKIELIGPKNKEKRLPHIANFLFKGVEGESILINLDMLGFAASSGSACTSGSLEPSHVTKAMGYSDLEAHGTVRFSLGELNKRSDIDELMKHLPGIIEKLRAMSPIKE